MGEAWIIDAVRIPRGKGKKEAGALAARNPFDPHRAYPCLPAADQNAWRVMGLAWRVESPVLRLQNDEGSNGVEAGRIQVGCSGELHRYEQQTFQFQRPAAVVVLPNRRCVVRRIRDQGFRLDGTIQRKDALVPSGQKQESVHRVNAV